MLDELLPQLVASVGALQDADAVHEAQKLQEVHQSIPVLVGLHEDALHVLGLGALAVGLEAQVLEEQLSLCVRQALVLVVIVVMEGVVEHDELVSVLPEDLILQADLILDLVLDSAFFPLGLLLHLHEEVVHNLRVEANLVGDYRGLLGADVELSLVKAFCLPELIDRCLGHVLVEAVGLHQRHKICRGQHDDIHVFLVQEPEEFAEVELLPDAEQLLSCRRNDLGAEILEADR
mmetsp:Transcript_103733/g.268478  ORF Transcript_103733/g.268478 Transcript_103733/m.268478 type:complete len:234 (-) Transcript_103733:3884-4585(-)